MDLKGSIATRKCKSLRSFHDSRNAALLAANQPSGARMKTVRVVLMLFVGLVVSSKSAPSFDSNLPSKRSGSVPGIWRYKVGEEKPMEIHFLPDHKAMFEGGYEFYNPAQWSFTLTTNYRYWNELIRDKTSRLTPDVQVQQTR